MPEKQEMIMKSRFFIILLILTLIPAFNLSGIEFSGLTLSEDDRLLYKIDFEGQSSIFISKLADLSIQQLTAYPEKLYLVENGRTILALSRFGAVKIPVSGGLPSPLPGYPSFAQGSIPLKGRLQDMAASPDGRWILHIEPVSAGYGNLLLIDVSSGAKWIISEKVELPGSDFPAKWNPTSRLFVYEKNGSLFYFPILSDLSTMVSERFRMIGPGGITSIAWGNNGHFYYITGNTLYQVLNPELFTRTIYGDFLSIGRAAAIIPFDFNPNFDRYWVAPDSGSILINKGARSFFCFTLGDKKNGSNSAAVNFLPHIPIPYGAENFNVLWGANSLTVCFSVQNEATAIRFNNINDNTSINTYKNISPLSNAALSPDRTKIIFWGKNGLELYDYEQMTLIQKLDNEPVLSCAWANSRTIITGNSKFIEEISIAGSSYQRRMICLSSAEAFGYEESSRDPVRVLARNGSDWYANDGRNAWVQVTGARLQTVSFASDRFRVFLEPQASGFFNNLPMIRYMQSTGTSSIIAKHTVNRVFTQGHQTQIAVCFDLYDDDTGLTQVLAALRRYNFRATFFMNGEFIRRNPLGAQAVVNAGHETGSMFYAPIDLSDTRYRITQEFIAQGLARNEDEFHRATGRELSILWHPPFYRTSNSINAAASSTGYITVQRTIDPGDWLSREDALRLNLQHISPSEIIEQIMAKKQAGAIVPVRIGILPGGRDEYLFQRIEVLLDALVRSGYVIVPVSAVVR